MRRIPVLIMDGGYFLGFCWARDPPKVRERTRPPLPNSQIINSLGLEGPLVSPLGASWTADQKRKRSRLSSAPKVRTRRESQGENPWPVGHDDGGQGPALGVPRGDHRRGDPQGTLSSWSLLGGSPWVLRQLFSFIIFDWENSCHRRQPHGEPQEREP